MMFRMLRIFLIVALCIPYAADAQKKSKPKKVKIVDADGNVSKGQMLDSVRVGTWKTYNKKGQQVEIINYTNGKEDGDCTYFFPDDSMFTKGRYANGKIDGMWGTYTNKGTLMHQAEWNKDTMNGVYYDYSNGKYIHGQYTKGKKTGWWIEENTREHSLDSSYFENGKQEGRHATYRNNQLHAVNHFRTGKLQGAELEYDSLGRLTKEDYYEAGSRDSVSRKFVNGKILEEYYFCAGRFCKMSREWDISNGALKTETRYDTLGNRTWNAGYDERGHLTRKSWYSPGGQMDSIDIYREDGTVWYSMQDTGRSPYTKGRVFYQDFRYPSGITQFCGFMSDSKRTGLWLSYDSSGHIERRMNYTQGALTGPFIVYYPNGKVRLQTNCFRGYADTMNIFTNAGKPVAVTDPLYNATLKDVQVTQQDIHFRNPNDYPKDAPLDAKTTVKAVSPAKQDPLVNTVAPSYPGGMDSLNAFTMRHAIFPIAEKAYSRQGTVWITFAVEADGRVTEIQISGETDNTPGFSREALRLARMMPKWIPGTENGKPNKQYCTIGFDFSFE